MRRDSRAGRRSSRRRTVLITLFFCAILIAGLVLYGCTTTIVPPPMRELREPVSVYIIDYGHHSGLALPMSEQQLVEYTYGEWWWFALGHNQPWDVLRALFLPTRGTLGRRVLELPAGDGPGWEDIPYDHLYELVVEHEHVAALLLRLDQRWLNGSAEEHVYNPVHDMEFVHDAMRYHVFNNCNPVMARWVKELGCEVRGWAIVSSWRVGE